MSGPRLRTDIVDVYVIRPRERREAGGGTDGSGPTVEVLQLRRARAPLAGTWQPVMGHVEPGERAAAAASREVREELGLDIADDRQCADLLALQQVHPFFVAELDAVVLSPRFAAVVHPGWEPTLNAEHGEHRWVPLTGAPELFIWPGQCAALAELAGLLRGGHPAALAAMRIDRSSLG